MSDRRSSQALSAALPTGVAAKNVCDQGLWSIVASARYSGAVPLMQKNFKFDATFDRKPVQLLENWCDVVTAWCEGNYPGSDVCLRQRFSQ